MACAVRVGGIYADGVRAGGDRRRHAAVVLFTGTIARACLRCGKDWDRAGRTILHVALSLAVVPVVLNPVWHATNDPLILLGVVWALLTAGYGLSTRRLSSAPLECAESSRRCFESASSKLIFLCAAVLIAVAVIGPYWPTELNGYPTPSLLHDFIKHDAVLFSLEQRPLPLGNPFFADGADGPVYYYHFFYLIPATLRAWSGGLSIELAFGLQSALLGVTLAGLFYLIVKRFTGSDAPATLAVLLATATGGLDVVPLALLRMPVVSVDAWADHAVRIHSLLTQMVWSPQNMQGVLIALVGVYLLSFKLRGVVWMWLGPLLAAGLIGASVWVSTGIFSALCIYAVFDIGSHRRNAARAARRLSAYAAAAVLMAAASAPSWLGYLEMSRRHGKSLTFDWPHQSHALLGKLAPPGVLANLLDLPWVLALELGPLLLFPLFITRNIWRRAWSDDGLRLLLIAAGAAIIGFTTVRSHFTYNDFGQKVMLIALSCGVVLPACIVAPRQKPATLVNPFGWVLHDQSPERPRRALAWFIGVTLILGLPLGCYQVPMMAIRRYIPESSPLRVFRHSLAKRAAAEAGASRFARYELPPGSVIQGHVGAERLVLAQISRKQIGVTILERDTMVFYPEDEDAHQRTLAEVRKALETPVAARRRHELLSKHGVTHVYIGEVEREHWRGLEMFDDQTFFRRVYQDEVVEIHALVLLESE